MSFSQLKMENGRLRIMGGTSAPDYIMGVGIAHPKFSIIN